MFPSTEQKKKKNPQKKRKPYFIFYNFCIFWNQKKSKCKCICTVIISATWSSLNFILSCFKQGMYAWVSVWDFIYIYIYKMRACVCGMHTSIFPIKYSDRIFKRTNCVYSRYLIYIHRIYICVYLIYGISFLYFLTWSWNFFGFFFPSYLPPNFPPHPILTPIVLCYFAMNIK